MLSSSMQVALCTKVVIFTVHTEEPWATDIFFLTVVATHKEVAAVLAFDLDFFHVRISNVSALNSWHVRRGRSPFGNEKLNDRNHMRGGKLFRKFVREVFRCFRPRQIFFDGAKIFENLAGTGAVETVQKSPKSEPS